MNRKDPKELHGSKIYLTEADLLAQELHQLSIQDLIIKLKAWLLLSDHIIVAGSHVLGSPMTARILQQYPRLLEDGTIVPYFRDECHDFTDYLDLKYTERDPEFLRQDRRTLISIANYLNEHCHTVVPWSPTSPSEDYRQSLIKELTDQESLLLSKLIGISRSDILKLVKDLEDATLVSRGVIAELAHRHLGRKRNVLVKHSNFLYYLWGAAYLDCEPVLHPETFSWGRDKLILSIGRLLRSDELHVLEDTLSALGLAKTLIEDLPMSEILSLRKEHVAKRFREKWYQLLQEAKKGIHADEMKPDLKHESEILYQLVHKEIEQEKTRKKRLRKTKTLISIGSVVTSGITTLVTDPILGLAALILGLASVDPLLSVIEQRLGGTEITLLCTRLQKRFEQ